MAPAGVDSSADRKIYLLPSSPDTRGRGICVVVDATRGPWRIARNVVRQVSNTLGGDIGCLLVLRHDAFWDNCTRAQRDSEVRSHPVGKHSELLTSTRHTFEKRISLIGSVVGRGLPETQFVGITMPKAQIIPKKKHNLFNKLMRLFCI